MKKKLTVNTLALGNIKNRKKQYTIMIIGIILAMVLSSSIVFLYSAAKETYISNHYKTHGYAKASSPTNLSVSGKATSLRLHVSQNACHPML